jgi:hypothetical protein
MYWSQIYEPGNKVCSVLDRATELRHIIANAHVLPQMSSEMIQ